MISTSNRGKIILDASEKAINLRQQQNLRLIDAVSVLDIAENLGVEVRFIDIPSMEGMYIKEPGPLILLTSLRHPGRLAFTCAHELGHHIYKHGTRVDELIENRIGTRGDDRDEFVASSFASFLLMPKTAINRAFSLREWDPQQSKPDQYYSAYGADAPAD
jgi:Zn-dependent peptidase ImmA (M78 family)